MTLNGWFLMRITWPVGSSPSPNNWSRTTAPRTATLPEVWTSWLLKNVPNSLGHDRMSGRSTSVPWMRVCQFWFWKMTCVRELKPAHR